jgi:hypothetical protein
VSGMEIIMKRIKLINRINYLIILLGFILYIASGFIFNRVDKISVSDKGVMTQIEPKTVKYIDNDTIEIGLPQSHWL